jgi:hypothetical protein
MVPLPCMRYAIGMENIDGLKGFRTLSPADRAQIAAATREQQVPAGKVLFGEQQPADMMGTTVETTIRITSKWQQTGIVSSSRHKVGLADVCALTRLAEGHDL